MGVIVWRGQVYVSQRTPEEQQREVEGTRWDSGTEFCFRITNAQDYPLLEAKLHVSGILGRQLDLDLSVYLRGCTQRTINENTV